MKPNCKGTPEMSSKTVAEKDTPGKGDTLVTCQTCSSTFCKKFASKHKSTCENGDTPRHPYLDSDARIHLNREPTPVLIDQFKSNFNWIKYNVAFLNPETMSLIGISLGGCIAVDFPIRSESSLQNNSNIYAVWPCRNLPIFTIGFTSKLSKKNKDSDQHLIQARKLVDVELISVTLFYNQEKSFFKKSEFLEFCKMYADGAFVSENSSLEIIFYGQKCHFVCKSLEFVDDVVEHSDSSALDKLVDDMSLLSVGKTKQDNGSSSWSIGRITSRTTIILKSKNHHISTSINNSSLTFDNLPGLFKVKQLLLDHIVWPLNLARNDQTVRKNWQIRSILFSGPSGCGKRTLFQYLVEKIGLSIIKFGVASTDLDLVLENVKASSNSVVIVEENLISKENMTKASALLCQLIDFATSNLDSFVFIALMTSNQDRLDLSLRRRFDLELDISTPDSLERRDILNYFLNFEFLCSVDLDDVTTLANKSHAFTIADLKILCKEAAVFAVRRKLTDPQASSRIQFDDLKLALACVRPSGMREIYAEIPKVYWSDIGGLDELKIQLKQAVEWPLKHPEAFERLGIKAPCGVLMYGPPGCAKTMAAKAIATESGLNFLSIKGPELFSKWVGESERAVRQLFHKARQVAPSVVFFDEIDALGAERSTNQKSSGVSDRVLAQLLTEMDGISGGGQSSGDDFNPFSKSVIVIAATNRPDIIDRALLRPGRLDHCVYVSLPDTLARKAIFERNLCRTPVNGLTISAEHLAQLTDGYSGAEVTRVCQEAALLALRDDMNAAVIDKDHFLKALQRIKPMTDPRSLIVYENFARGQF